MFTEITVQTELLNEVMIHVNESGIVTRIYGYVSDWNINEAFTHVYSDKKRLWRVKPSKNKLFFNFQCSFRSFCKRYNGTIYVENQDYNVLTSYYGKIENLVRLQGQS